MTKHFSVRLQSNNCVLRFSKGDAVTFLRADALVAPTFSAADTVAELREYCAAWLWVRGPGYSSQALRGSSGLPPVARITLCTVLRVATQPPEAQATSDRIRQAVLSRSSGGAAAQPAGAAAAAPGGGYQQQ